MDEIEKKYLKLYIYTHTHIPIKSLRTKFDIISK